MNFQKLLFICGLEQSRRDLLQMILPIGEKIIFTLKNPTKIVIKMKLSITLDTLTARILKLSSDSQSRIEPTPFYSWWDPTDCLADPAVAPVTHEIPPDHEFQFFHFVMFCLSVSMIKQFLLHSCPDAFTSRIIMASSSRTIHALHNAIFLNDFPICSTGILAAPIGMHNGSADFREPQIRMFQRFTTQFGTHMIRHRQTHWQQVIAVKNR